MIQRLRRRFITTNMLLVSLVLLAVFAMQTFSVYRGAREQVLQAQLQAMGRFLRSSSPSFVFDRRPPDGKRDFPGVPAFAVMLDGQGRIMELVSGPGVEVTGETAQAMVDEVLAHGGSRGSLPGQALSYLYRREEGLLAFADNTSAAAALRSQVLTSLLICAAAELAFFLISRFLAKRSLRPVETAWEQQRQFVADASHELKTPLAVILANTDLVLSHPQDTVEAQGKWLGYIQDEARRMRALVEDLLFLAKSDAQRLPLRPAPVQFSQLVTGSLLPFESVAFEAGVSLSDRIAPGLTTQGDQEQLRRMVVILLDNAVKYAGEKGAVTVELSEAQGRLRLSVHNTGPAITPEHLPHLFERFYRSDSARDRSQGGAGLGLAIAQSIAQVHGGGITASSTPETGTVFTVTLPKK